MIRNFFSTPNVLGRLLIVLLFVGGVVYAGVFDGFVVETEASGCCGGGTDASLFSSSKCRITAATKSCSSDCNDDAADRCGPDKDYSLCETKGDEYDPEDESGNCCDPDFNGDCDT